MIKPTAAFAGLLVATALAQSALSGTAVAWRDSGGSVQVDTDELRCTISPKGVVSGNHKTFPGAFGAVLRNRKGEGIAGSSLDGNMDNWPARLFVQDSCRGSLELLEDGPLRVVARFTLQGAAQGSPTGTVLKIERMLTAWANSGTVFTEFRFESKTPVAYPWVMLAFTDPRTAATADILDFATSSGAAGQAPAHKTGQWLVARLDAEPAWMQLQVGDVTVGYLFPPGGSLEGKTFTSGKGEQASDLRTLAYRGTCGDGPAFAWPLALVFADQNRRGGDWTAKHVADRYFPDGRPRGIAVRTRSAEAGAIAIEVAETSGLERDNIGLELALPALPAGAVLRLENGTILGSQLKNHDPSTRTIAFQLPQLKANETAALLLVPGAASGMPSSLRESWSRTQRSMPLAGPPSPHVDWAAPRMRRLQAFFFTEWSRCRELFELQQRLDMDCDYALTAGGALLESGSLWLRGAGRRLGEADEARRLLRNFRHDAIVIPDPRTYAGLPDDLKTLIREKTMAGIGLVLLNGAELPGAVNAELPACLAGSKVTVKTLGRGRIVASPQGYDFDVMPKAMLWAAGVVPAAQIERVDFPATQTRGVPATATLELRSALQMNADYRLEAIVLDQVGEVVAGSNRLVTLQPGVNQVTWELNGNHRADTFRLGFILRDRDGNALDYSCRNFNIESSKGIAGIVVGTNTLRVGQTLSGSCQVSGQGPLTLSLKDTWGRVLQRQTLEAGGDGSEVPFSFPAIETETFLLVLDAELADAAGPVARKSLDIHISRPRRIDDLRIEAYMLRDCTPLALERLREAGVDAGGVYFSKGHEPNVLAMRRNNVDIIANMTYGMPAAAPPPVREGAPSEWPAPTADDPHNIRLWDKRPSCPQAEHFAWSPGAYRRSAGDMPERYSPFAYDLCDEYMFQRHVYDLKGGRPYDELGYCRHTLEAFRAWLRDSYGTLESLNRQWDTAYGTWEEVIPPPARLARLKVNISAWLDFRIFLAEDVAHRLAAKQNGELPPGASASANVLYEGPFSAFMTYYLFGPGGLNASDCYPDTLDKVRAFSRHPENRRIVLGYTAWGETTEKFFGNCWRNVLHGGGRIGVYNAMETCMDSSVLTPTYGEGELWGKVRRIRRTLGDSGIAKMMLTSQPAPARIGVLQSYRSGFAAFLEPRNFDEAGWLAAKDGFARYFDGALAAAPGFAAAAENARLGWRYLADEQISAPGMAGLDAILMPGASCVSDGALAALAAFVDKGGLLVADFHFADFDGRGKPRSDFAAVNALFGMRKDQPNWSRTKQELSIDVGEKRTVISAGRDEQVRGGEGQVLGRYTNGVPALILARHGKGMACYLNAALPAGKLKEIVNWLLDAAGIRGDIRIVDEKGAPVPGQSLFVRRNGDIQYLAVLGSGGKDSGRRFLALPRPRQVYSVLDQKDLGVTDSVELTLTNAEGVVFALPPYAVNGVRLALDKQVVEQGSAVEFSLELRIGRASPGAHVVRLEVYDPRGRLCPYWTRNVLAEGGRHRGRMAIALNEAAGAWRIRAIDAMSGKADEGRFTVQRMR